jgi:hypothetical protein
MCIPRVKEDAFRGRRLARVDVGNDADVSDDIQVVLGCQYVTMLDLQQKGRCQRQAPSCLKIVSQNVCLVNTKFMILYVLSGIISTEWRKHPSTIRLSSPKSSSG